MTTTKEKGKMTITKEKKYHSTIGRRKSARARVRLYNGKGKIQINDKDWQEYFLQLSLRETVMSPLQELGVMKDFDFTIVVRGGGVPSQAEAVRLGISRALISFKPEWKSQLKTAGYLSRDPRSRERKKYGHRRARKSAQWHKR